MPHNEYRKWDALNFSDLKHGLASMEHLEAALQGHFDTDDTPDLRFGRALHTAILEPEEFQKTYAVTGPCAKNIASGKNKGNPCGKTGKLLNEATAEWFCGVHGNDSMVEVADAISPEEYAKIRKIRDKLAGHRVSKLLKARGGCELAIVWEKEVNGVKLKLKAKIDKGILDTPGFATTVVDLKGVKRGGASDWLFAKAIADYDWDMQSAVYSDAVHAATGRRVDLYCWLAVEKDYPFSVNPITRTDIVAKIGEVKYHRVLEDFVECIKSGRFPGYSDDLHEIAMPGWYTRQWGDLFE